MYDAEWAVVAPLLPLPRWLDGHGGPAHLPPWRLVHDAFARWWGGGELREPSAAITDSQSIRAAETVGKQTSGYNGGKRVGGRKRHIAVDTLGLLLVCVVTAADVQDRDGAKPLSERLHAIHEQILLAWADGAYAGELVDWAKDKLKLAWTSSSAPTT